MPLSMDNLPPEIICEIFLKTLSFVINGCNIPYSESISSPLRISHVCRSWRELALSFRELWSHLYLSHQHFPYRKKRRMMVEIFDTWLARTNDGPINFVVNCSLTRRATIPLATAQDHRNAEYVLTRLIENQRRWKDVHIFCHGVDFTAQFPGFYLIDMPLLTSLRMSMNHSVRSVVDFTQSSRLRRLTMQHEVCNLLTGGGLSHLERAELFFSFPKSHPVPETVRNVVLCLKLLKSAPSLSRLLVSTRSGPSTSPLLLDEDRILHTGLRELVLWEDHDSVLPAMVLDSVTLPSLEQFTFCCRVGGESLLHFFQRSMPPLAYLEINENDVSEDYLISILRLLPTLEKLNLSKVKLSHRFFRELVVPGGTGDAKSALRHQVVCPGLSFFEAYGWSSGTDAGLEALLTMAKSRASILGTLQMAHFSRISPNDGRRTFAVASIDINADVIDPNRTFTLC